MLHARPACVLRQRVHALQNDHLKIENESLEAQIVRIERKLQAREHQVVRMQVLAVLAAAW